MSDEIRLAFAHPSERASASSDRPFDRISLRDYIVEVEIGAFHQERGHLQRLRFNVVVEVHPTGGQVSDDDVDSILSYDRVTEAIQAEIGTDRINLLETLAARVADRILGEPQAARVFVRIEKLDRGPFALGVEIVRSRDTAPSAAQSDAPRPRVIFLGNAALEGVAPLLDAELARGAPVLLCVGLPEGGVPQAADPQAQRRIDLLGIEQNAWALSAREKRVTVIGSRTELDWSMRNGQTCVWAPMKLVLDAAEAPGPDPRDAVALAAWFAAQMQAVELVVVGAPAPATKIAVREVPA
ncbi:dihydroneopterin aldolase [Salipiger sp. IMCC34102]|uniref:dihydroneopterin aldolase n=1 Tax=Salipiger sp. IMCC34102 TaxID=2510647 RepID=UPI00101C6D0A|nr:dihydroneopterin aldolase [Salipiger sp. IMCC34102]RYH02393.1 dihydroneopterin aldolase [Salipiger sp. IMCC34102]